jgi:Mannosyltransferase OCH1 and related enzymes
MPTNLNSRSLRLTLALIIPFALICYLYSWNQTPTLVPSPSTPQSFETTTGTGSPASISVPTKEPSTSDRHPGTSAAPIYTLPDKVWHSAKFDNLSENQREWTGSWTRKNPSIRQELLTDRSAEAFVRAHYFKTRPDIVEVYEALPIPILRADLFRYLVVLAEGGIWGDLDTSCEKEVAEWVPLEYRNANIDMIVGLEFDFEWRGAGTKIASQFCNWVFVGRKSSRNLQVIVDTVLNNWRVLLKQTPWASKGLPWKCFQTWLR